MDSNIKPPFPYFGAKQTLASRIVELLPPHAHYVEPFGGSLAVLLAKPRSAMETVNDLDGDLMHLWRTIREQPEDLARVCALTPHGRAEHEESYADLEAFDGLERARRVWVRLTQGRGGMLRRTGWRYFQDPGMSSFGMPGYLAGYVDRIAPCAGRLAGVTLEQRDAADLIASYGRHRGVLLYVDPPYLGATRAWGNRYRHELRTEEQHRALADALGACRATVVLSGYHSPLYDELYRDWERVEFDAFTGQASSGRRTEVIWANTSLAAPDLFSTEDVDATQTRA